MAGTGKSTIARTVARECAVQQRLAASFFFSKGHNDLGNANKFFTTIATQLANSLPALKADISSAITKNPQIHSQSLHGQWNDLIYKPLSNLEEASLQTRLFVIVIDALDECGDEEDIPRIIQLLARSKSLDTIRLRIFVTSRRETPIRFGFSEISQAHEDLILHNIPQPIVEGDISIFFRHELGIIGKKNSLQEGWVDQNTINVLCQRANGLFIYASTACLFIQGRRRVQCLDPERALSTVLGDGYQGLDGMYIEILKASTNQEEESGELQDEVKRIVGSIAIVFEPLPVGVLASLLDIRRNILHHRVLCLHSVLDVPDTPESESPIRVLHPSFRDFLLDKKRCQLQDLDFWVDGKKTHNDLFVSCLRLMSQHLKEDMCDLRLPGTLASDVEPNLVTNRLPPEVQYACRFWVNHLQYGNIDDSDMHAQVDGFLNQYFLYWIEALSLLGRTSDGIHILRDLESLLKVSDSITR